MRLRSGVCVFAFIFAGCGTSSNTTDPSSEPDIGGTDGTVDDTTDDTTNDTAHDTRSDATDALDSGSTGCSTGSACGDGGVCTGDGTCCDPSLACGTTCCPEGDVCSYGKCVIPGGPCVDATECKINEMCDYAFGPAPSGDAGTSEAGSCMGGAELKKGVCLPRPPLCADPTGDAGVDGGDGGAAVDGGAGGISCLEKCEYHPPLGKFEPILKYGWGDPAATNAKDSVMMTPIVVQLDDDNCDGVVDERDIPEIVFSTFASGLYNEKGTLHAISIVDKKVVEKWAVPPAASNALWPGAHLAAGNIDGVPGNEIVTCTRGSTVDGTAHVRAYDAKGKELWLSAVVSCFAPSIADLDGDGAPEVITESHILDGKTGVIKYALASPGGGETTAADVTGDGVPEIVSSLGVWDNTGVLLADATAATVTNALPGGNHVAIGDFDKDGVPEIVTADYTRHQLHVWRYDPTAPGKVKVVRKGIDINGSLSPSLCPAATAGNTKGGGPPTIADFNGDGTPDVGMAGGIAYGVYDGKKLLDATIANPALWLKQTHDCSSAATGSSVFDFDGDGKAEVIYSDEWYLRIYSGTDGTELFKTCNTTGTLSEYPVIADVDNDGHADIVVASNSYSATLVCPTGSTKQSGIRVFGDTEGKWVRTRRIWNQHTYHVTNVLENGNIPKVEASNWKTPRLDNFRQNMQPVGVFAAPDLVVDARPSCDGTYNFIARVRNVGEAPVEAPIPVGLYVDKTLIDALSTTHMLYPGEAEEVLFTLLAPPPGTADGTKKIHAVVDDGMPPHPWHECRTDNNVSPEVSVKCK